MSLLDSISVPWIIAATIAAFALRWLLGRIREMGQPETAPDHPKPALHSPPPEGPPHPSVGVSEIRSAEPAPLEGLTSEKQNDAPVIARPAISSLVRDFESLRSAVILREILGPPLALRPPGERDL